MSLFRMRQCFFVLTCLSLLAFTSACTRMTTVSNTGPIVSTQSTPSPTPVGTQQVSSVRTDCPAANTARAAVMPAITLGTHTNLFYTAVTNNAFTIRRYDVVTGQTTQVISIPHDPQDVHPESWKMDARLSKDGQWITFHRMIGLQDAIQMVRVDGQELQTLYCGLVGSMFSMVLSPDQKTLAFSTGSGNLEMLDLNSGKLQTDYTPSTPSGADFTYYEPLKWYTNTSLFVMLQKTGLGGISDFPMRYNFGIYLMKDTTLDSNSQATNFQNMFPQLPIRTWLGACGDFDFSQSQILTSDCAEKDTVSGPSTIKIQTLNGTASTIYTDPKNAIMYARFASQTKILFFTQNLAISSNTTGRGSMTSRNVATWEINTDGTGLTQLGAFQDNRQFWLDQFSYTPSYTVSRDGNDYAVAVGPTLYQTTDVKGLFFGKFQGTSVEQVPGTFVAGLYPAIVGWSTF